MKVGFVGILFSVTVGFVFGWFGASQEILTPEETCAEYTIKWESYERDIKNIDRPAPDAMTIGVYERCLNIMNYQSPPADDATAPRVLP